MLIGHQARGLLNKESAPEPNVERNIPKIGPPDLSAQDDVTAHDAYSGVGSGAIA